MIIFNDKLFYWRNLFLDEVFMSRYVKWSEGHESVRVSFLQSSEDALAFHLTPERLIKPNTTDIHPLGCYSIYHAAVRVVNVYVVSHSSRLHWCACLISQLLDISERYDRVHHITIIIIISRVRNISKIKLSPSSVCN